MDAGTAVAVEMSPASVDVVARSWEGQALDLRAAAAQVGSADRSGFTVAVAGDATRFLTAWEQHVARLALTCEDAADALHRSAADLLATDRAVGHGLVRRLAEAVRGAVAVTER